MKVIPVEDVMAHISSPGYYFHLENLGLSGHFGPDHRYSCCTGLLEVQLPESPWMAQFFFSCAQGLNFGPAYLSSFSFVIGKNVTTFNFSLPFFSFDRELYRCLGCLFSPSQSSWSCELTNETLGKKWFLPLACVPHACCADWGFQPRGSILLF